MKIAYLTYARPNDQFAWSGLNYYMRRSLESAGLEVEVIGSMLFPPVFWPERLVHLTAERMGLARRHMWIFEPRVIREYTRQIERRLAASSADAIFSSGTMLISQLKSSRPICFWSDATFASMINYYFFEEVITAETFLHGDELERAAIGKATRGFYSSDWAAQSAIKDYHANPQRIHVVPFGANLEKVPTEDEVAKFIEDRPREPCRLLFLGVEWIRKGGDFALAMAEHLTKQGLRCELTLAGCRPPPEIVLPPYVKVLGFINKHDAADNALMQKLMQESHSLVLPSRADCTPIVMSEANAYGVPLLTTQTGGIPSVIHNDVNGFCVPLGETLVKQLAGHVMELMSKPERYRALACSSRREYVTRLNWETSARQIKTTLEEL